MSLETKIKININSKSEEDPTEHIEHGKILGRMGRNTGLKL